MLCFQLLLLVLLCQGLSGHHGSPRLLGELLSGWLHHGVVGLLQFWNHRMELSVSPGVGSRPRSFRFSRQRYGQPNHLGSVAALWRSDFAALAEPQWTTISPVDGVHFGEAAAGVLVSHPLRRNLGWLVEVVAGGHQPRAAAWRDPWHGLSKQQQGASWKSQGHGAWVPLHGL